MEGFLRTVRRPAPAATRGQRVNARLGCSSSDRSRRANAASRRSPRTSSTATISASLSQSEVIAIEEPGAPERAYPPAVVANLIQNDRDSYRDDRRVRQRAPLRRAEHPARIRFVRRRRRRVDRRSDRARAQAGHRFAAHRAAGTVARSHARRAHDLRDGQRRRRPLGHRPRHPHRALRHRSARRSA